MSENIRGITFAEQVVTPADDAVIRRAIFGDGILAGCEVSYSGSTLTMAAGYIIACGRTFQVTAAQNWAVVDATSGYARLLVTLDLTKTSTEDVFSQVEFSIEYASAEDGFVDLAQEDVNVSGTKYQVVLAVVSLGTGGITRIVSKAKLVSPGLSAELVWENARPNSDFADQSVSLDLSADDHILVEFVDAVPAMIVRKGMTAYCSHLNVTSTSSNKVVIEARRRAVNFNDSRVIFSGCNATMYTTTSGKFSDLSVNNASVKPLRIYRLKGVF